MVNKTLACQQLKIPVMLNYTIAAIKTPGESLPVGTIAGSGYWPDIKEGRRESGAESVRFGWGNAPYLQKIGHLLPSLALKLGKKIGRDVPFSRWIISEGTEARQDSCEYASRKEEVTKKSRWLTFHSVIDWVNDIFQILL